MTCVALFSTGSCAGLLMRHGLAVIAVRLAMQLVEHVCHWDDASVDRRERNTGNERGVQLIMGKIVAATRLLSVLGG